MNLNLTCSKTHILAWINSDNTLSLKLNGVKYLVYPKLDKRGDKYWKMDGLSHATPTNPQAPETLKEEIEVILKKPMSEQTKEDRKKWAEWVKVQSLKDKLEKPSIAQSSKEPQNNEPPSPQ